MKLIISFIITSLICLIFYHFIYKSKVKQQHEEVKDKLITITKKIKYNCTSFIEQLFVCFYIIYLQVIKNNSFLLFLLFIIFGCIIIILMPYLWIN